MGLGVETLILYFHASQQVMCNRHIKGKTVYLHNLEKNEANTEETTLIVKSSCS